jgi:hypothetical protein
LAGGGRGTEIDGRVPTGRATGGKVRGEEKLQGLTAVRLDYLSRVGMAGKEDLDSTAAMLRRPMSAKDLRVSVSELWGRY